jgi:RecA-family ATPase
MARGRLASNHAGSLLTGDGGSGKSLVAQQMATCVALGLPFMGVPARQQRALYITCEDDLGELHRCQEAICESLGVGMAELDGKLCLLSRCGELDNLILHFGSDGVIAPSRFYSSIEAAANTNVISFIVLDNIAHLFEGNENIHNHVAIFCNALEMLARSIVATILFLGHPSKNGAQFSGSTAWENQVRSRLYLARPDEQDGQYDPNLRILSRAKANYAKTGESLKFRWNKWAFTEATEAGDTWSESLATSSEAGRENQIFLACLAKANSHILGMASIGVEPRFMGICPLPATEKLLARLGLSIGDFDTIELNEAFASQGIAVMRALGLADDAAHVNPNGGAIARPSAW